MVDLQTAVSTLMEYGLSGGDSAFNELLKGVAVNTAQGLSKTWQDIFSAESSTKALMVSLQQDQNNQALQLGLEAIILQVLKDNPQIAEQVSYSQQNNHIKNVEATKGGVAIGVNNGTINQK